MTLTCERAPFLCYLKLCTSLCSQRSIKTGVTYSPKTLNSGENRQFFVPFDLQIWQMTFKNNRAPFPHYYSLVHHFIAVCEFKLVLQSGNAQIGSKLAMFVLCDTEIWRMTLKNNRARLLCHIKPCTSFHHHMWIQIWVKSPETAKLGYDLCDLDLLHGHHICQ